MEVIVLTVIVGINVHSDPVETAQLNAILCQSESSRSVPMLVLWWKANDLCWIFTRSSYFLIGDKDEILCFLLVRC